MMELRRKAQSVVRTQWSPFFLNASSRASCNSTRDLTAGFPSLAHRPLRHGFSTATRHRAQAATARNVPDPEEDDDISPSHQRPSQQPQSKEPSQRVQIAERYTTEQPQRPPSPNQPRSKDKGQMAFLQKAQTAPSPLSNRSLPKNPNPASQTQPPPPRPRASLDPAGLVDATRSKMNFLRGSRTAPSSATRTTNPDGKTSLDEMMRGISMPLESSTNKSTPYDSRSRARTDTSSMLSPYGTSPQDFTRSPAILERERKNYEAALAQTMAHPGFRLAPGLGRTVAVDATRGMDVARAFQMCNIKCGANSVRSDVGAQKFYERPGVRRKRLASVRFRRRFKEGFRATVRRVEELKRKGW